MGPIYRVPEVDRGFRERLGRRAVLVVCNNCTGKEGIAFEIATSLRGPGGEVGLEGYQTFHVHRLRGVENSDIILQTVKKTGADGILVAAPPRDLLRRLKRCSELPDWFLKVCWCPKPAGEKGGFDIFASRETTPADMARMIVEGLSSKGLVNGKKGERPKKKGLWSWLIRCLA